MEPLPERFLRKQMVNSTAIPRVLPHAMTKRKRRKFNDVRPPRIPSVFHWKPGSRHVPDSAGAAELPESPPELKLVSEDKAVPDVSETAEDIELDVKRLLSWPVVAPREDPPGHTIGLREV